MKFISFTVFLLITFLFSCKKGNPVNLSNPALKYIGSYLVEENATSTFPGAYNGISAFYGNIELGDSIGKIKFDQRSRSPMPYWSMSPNTVIECKMDNNKLIGTGTTYGEIYTKDSLYLTYIAGNTYTAGYYVKQIWVRRK